jgi:glutaminyl-tRNA synthetase
LCTVEFIEPRQSEYGRLNITGTLMSKRKILALVKEGYVRDWDDPRLYTLIALRRRGIPPGAILAFVSSLGVSTSPSNIQVVRFEQSVRQYLESTAPRLLMVLRPLKVTLSNVADDYVVWVEKPLHPKITSLGSSKIPFAKTLYIDRDDFRLEDAPDYFRLAPGKTVGLFQGPHPITCTDFVKDASGEVVELICKLEEGMTKKPKAFIQWVAEHAPSGSPVRVDETRITYPLFKSENPAALPNFRDDINPNSEEIVRGALVEVGLWPLIKNSYASAFREARERTEKARKENPQAAAGAHTDPHDDTPVPTVEQLVGKECVRFQGLRVAYFALDKDAKVSALEEGPDVTPGRRDGDYLVLNRIVSLKEDAGKSI